MWPGSLFVLLSCNEGNLSHQWRNEEEAARWASPQERLFILLGHSLQRLRDREGSGSSLWSAENPAELSSVSGRQEVRRLICRLMEAA